MKLNVSKKKISNLFERMSLAANANISNLPEELLEHIFNFLPLKKLISARGVSRSWRQHIEFKIDSHLGVRRTSRMEQYRSLENVRNRIWVSQESEIQYLKSNLDNIINANYADNNIVVQCQKIRMCPNGASSIALYARELRLDGLNEAIILGKILESQHAWRRFEKCTPRPGKILDCRSCFLTRFPTTLIQDQALKDYWQTLAFLFLSHNQFSYLPDNMQMPLLQSLEIHGNQLQSLPESIGSLRSLRVLDVGDNRLECLPQNIGRLESLRMLVVKNNNIVYLPDELVSLKQLRHFYASHNKLKDLPKDVHGLKELEVLDLSHNDLENLPDSMANMQNCRLYVHSNYLQVLPFNIERMLYSSHLAKCNSRQVLATQKRAQKITHRNIVQNEF